MSPVIPDPEDPERIGLRDDGQVMYGVWTCPLDDDGKPTGEWSHVGWHDPTQFKAGPIVEEGS